MITSEPVLFDAIPQLARQLVFKHLLDDGRLNLFLYRKLCLQAELYSIDDLCQHYTSVDDFVARNKGTGQRVASELQTFLMSLDTNIIQPIITGEVSGDLGEEIQEAPTEEFADISIEHLNQQGLISNILFNKLYRDAKLQTIGDYNRKFKSVLDFQRKTPHVGQKVVAELTLLLFNLANSSDLHQELVEEGQLGICPQEVASIPLEFLNKHGLISNILFNKLHRDAKLELVGDFYQQFRSVQDFQRKTYSVGKRVIKELTDLLEKFSLNTAPFQEAVEREKAVFLPLEYCDTDNIIDNFKRIVADVQQVLIEGKGKTDGHYVTILEYFFTDKKVKRQYTLEDVGILLQLHRERVRQLKIELVNYFSTWLQDVNNELVPKHFAIPQLREDINSLFNCLTNRYQYMTTEAELDRFFEEKLISISGSERAFDLLFELYGISRCGKVETNFTEANFYSMKPGFDHKSFLVIANIVLDVLKDEVVPMTKQDLAIRVNKGLKKFTGTHSIKQGKIPHHYFDIALAQLPEIEMLSGDEENLYQTKYPYLSSNAARTERILFELGGRHTFLKILAEMKNRAELYHLDENYEEQSVRSQMLSGNGRVQSHGKLGLYEWVSPEALETVKAQSKVELVKAALKIKGDAATLPEIELYVNAHLMAIDAMGFKNVKSTSAIISYLINRGEIIRLQRGQYILKNWEPRYIDEIETINTARNPKGKIRVEIIDILSAIPDHTMPRRVLSKRLFEAGYPRPTITSTIVNTPVLDLFEKDNMTHVRLKENHLDFSKPQQQDVILKSMTELLLNTKTHSLPLPIVVKKLQKEFSLSRSQLPVVYKIVTANPHLFEKSESVSGQKSLTLLAVPKSSDVSFVADKHWPELKNKIIAKLSPKLSGILTHSLDETLNIFFDVAMLPTGEADLEALDLMPGYIWKFFSGMADEHFEHSLVREIATSIEPYLLKVLYLTSPNQYSVYQSEQTKGLSKINYLLSRVQYAHSQRLKDAFFKAKNTRDTAAHTARSWSSPDRSDRVLACLTQILYSVNCYFPQLRSCLATDMAL